MVQTKVTDNITIGEVKQYYQKQLVEQSRSIAIQIMRGRAGLTTVEKMIREVIEPKLETIRLLDTLAEELYVVNTGKPMPLDETPPLDE